MKIVGMVPARLESSRLPEKALVDILGLPMVVHTCKRAQLSSSLNEVYLVTDNLKIKEVGERYDLNVIMTKSDHKTGSDRIAEAADHVEADIIVNIQGDEPLVEPDHIDKIVQPLIDSQDLQVSCGVTSFTKRNSYSDIKAVLDLEGNILYCSRTDIPSDSRSEVHYLNRMCFIIPFRKSFLKQYTSWGPTPLEQIEYNEYLRILEHGVKMKAVIIEDAKISVDTIDDLNEVREMMKHDVIRKRYQNLKRQPTQD